MSKNRDAAGGKELRRLAAAQRRMARNSGLKLFIRDVATNAHAVIDIASSDETSAVIYASTQVSIDALRKSFHQAAVMEFDRSGLAGKWLIVTTEHHERSSAMRFALRRIE